MLCAVKFHIHCKALLRGRSQSRIHKSKSRNPQAAPEFTDNNGERHQDMRVATEAINGALSYMSFLVRRAYAAVHQLTFVAGDEQCLGETSVVTEEYVGMRQQQNQPRSPLHVSRAPMRWLGLNAFRVVLRRKQTFYRATLLPWIDSELAVFSNIAGQLGAVVDPGRHAFMKRIRF